MLRNIAQLDHSQEKSNSTGADRRLQAILWTLWTLAVVVAAFIHWRIDVAAERPLNLVGIAIYAGLTGTIGLVVLTMIEIWLEPQRFVD
jgi:hypothetical protein